MSQQSVDPPAELRRRRRHREARRAILRAAEALLVEEGYESLTMRKLADRCGYTPPTIYHYFGDKSGLVDALLEEVFAKLVDQLQRAKRPDDPLDRMRVLFREFVDFGVRNPTHYRLLTSFREDEREPPPSGERAREILSQPLDTLAASGRVVPPDVEEVRQCFWALLHGLISLQTNRPDVAWSATLVDASLEAMIAGLLESAGGGGSRAGTRGGKSP